MSDVLPILLLQTQRDYALAAAIRWVPTAVSIVVALIVAASTWSRRVAVGTALTLGLVFEVVGSFGIAVAQLYRLVLARGGAGRNGGAAHDATL